MLDTLFSVVGGGFVSVMAFTVLAYIFNVINGGYIFPVYQDENMFDYVNDENYRIMNPIAAIVGIGSVYFIKVYFFGDYDPRGAEAAAYVLAWTFAFSTILIWIWCLIYPFKNR